MKNIFLKMIVGIMMLAQMSSASQNFTFMAEDLPPFIYANANTNEPEGIAIKIVQELAQKMNHPMNIEIASWNKAYNLIKDNDGYALFPVSRRPNREALFKWVGPLLKSTSYLYKRRGSDINIKTLNDAKKVSAIGVVKNYAGHQLLQKEGFENLIAVGHTKGVIRALAFKRADLIEVGDVFLPFRSKQADVDYKLLENTNVKLLEQYQYLAFSKNTPDEVVQKWQNALDEMKEDGTYNQISNIEFINALKAFQLE
ncbi:MAG: transporter substrate-binding domain-containing protein [Campylobacteraceae bacterium]|nr:transporter substrate-binding domain-containing protein [Campylobacteraceae bacterium]